MKTTACATLMLIAAGAAPLWAVQEIKGKKVGAEIRYCGRHDIYDHCWSDPGSAPAGSGPSIGTVLPAALQGGSTWKQLATTSALQAGPGLVTGVLGSLFGSKGPSRAEREATRRREEESRARMEAIRVAEERLGRIRAAAAMRAEWERRDAEMSERLAGVLDIVPVRKSTPFFGIEGNPDDALVEEALAADAGADPGRAFFDGSGRSSMPLAQLEAKLRAAYSNTFTVDAGDAFLDAPEDLRDAVSAQGYGTQKSLIQGAPPAPVAGKQGLSSRIALITDSTRVEPTPILPGTARPSVVVASPIQRLPLKRDCSCKGEGCVCIYPICGGTRGCSCRPLSVDCTCNSRQCKFAGTNSCCGGTHEDSAIGRQRCNTTCACGHAAGGPAGCSVSCRHCPNRPVAPDSRR